MRVMSLAEPQQQGPERRLSPGLTINLSQPPTNNPFRKGMPSPALSPPMRPTSSSGRPNTNPFLDNPPELDAPRMQARQMAPQPKVVVATPSESADADAAPLLRNLTLVDGPPQGGPPPMRPQGRPTRRPENIPPINGSSPARPKDEGNRRMAGRPLGPPPQKVLDIFADPPTDINRRPRRNSDSSVVEHRPMTEEDRKRREQRQREREARHKRQGSKDRPGTSGGARKPSRRLDIIDKLDVTSIYGTELFHHDGPFDACNPHRNRKGSQRAPMRAFAADSLNNVLGGSGPVNKTLDIAKFHGHGPDSFDDYNTTVRSAATTNGGRSFSPPFDPYAGASGPMRGDARHGVDRTTSFNAAALVEPVYGDETAGLGATTFLEGAPAPRSAIQRRESEGDAGGLSRKKSLAQKLRGISNGRSSRERGYGLNSPDARYERHTPGEGEAQSAGGLGKIVEVNPFEKTYENAYSDKGARVRAAEEEKERASAGVSEYPRPMERVVTEANIGAPSQPEESKGGGFLNRVKSLRTGTGRPKPRVQSG